MTGVTRKFDKKVIMSFRVSNKQLIEKYNKISEKIEKLLNIDLKTNLFMMMMINTEKQK